MSMVFWLVALFMNTPSRQRPHEEWGHREAKGRLLSLLLPLLARHNFHGQDLRAHQRKRREASG